MKHSIPLRVVVVGSVSSTKLTLECLIRHRFSIAGVLGLSPARASGVSGYIHLEDLARSAGAPYQEFMQINDSEVLETLRGWAPDLLFVVGLSQLVSRDILDLPRIACVGYHPTWLPRGRGRAPAAWLILDAQPGAATFFQMDEGADSGPILVQEPFYVSEYDYVGDLIPRAEAALIRALDRWLPRVSAGEWNPVPQEDSEATYNGRRGPADGLLSWDEPAPVLERLVRAASRPHPGAYTYCQGHRVRIWRAEAFTMSQYRGVVGRILAMPEGEPLVQTGAGILRVQEFEIEGAGAPMPHLHVGVRLGYAPEDRIHELEQKIHQLEARLEHLAKQER